MKQVRDFPELHFPPLSLRTRENHDNIEIWDPLRKVFLKLEPEEWVRQHWITYLHEYKKFPLGTGQSEVGLTHLNQKKRCDILWNTPQGDPLLLVECKAPHVKLNQQVLDQICFYNLHFRVPYLLLSNGIHHIFVSVNFKTKETSQYQEIPLWEEIRLPKIF